MGFFSRQSPNPLQNPVIAKPTISIVPKNSEKDQLLLLGSDGIFDVFENSEDLAHYALNRFQVFFSNDKDDKNFLALIFLSFVQKF